MDAAGLITLVGQLGFAFAAWRLASQLKVTVQGHSAELGDHDKRLSLVEHVIANAVPA